ncbi:MAG: hypothetical protein ACR2QW_06935 [bacterium]
MSYPGWNSENRPAAFDRMQQIVNTLDDGMTRRDIENALDHMEMIVEAIDPQLHNPVANVIVRLHQEFKQLSGAN